MDAVPLVVRTWTLYCSLFVYVSSDALVDVWLKKLFNGLTKMDSDLSDARSKMSSQSWLLIVPSVVSPVVSTGNSRFELLLNMAVTLTWHWINRGFLDCDNTTLCLEYSQTQQNLLIWLSYRVIQGIKMRKRASPLQERQGKEDPKNWSNDKQTQ